MPHGLVEQAAALAGAGAIDEAWETGLRAVAEARAEAGDVLAAVALLLPEPADGRRRAELHGLCLQALDLIHGSRIEVRTRLALRATRTASRWAGPSATEVPSPAPVEPLAAFKALQAEYVTNRHPAHTDRRRSLAERALRLGLATGSRGPTVWGRLGLVDAHGEHGERAALDAQLAALDDLAAVGHSRVEDPGGHAVGAGPMTTTSPSWVGCRS